MVYISNSEEETRKIAQQLDIKRPMIISLNGELGAGKTVFAKALLEKLGVLEYVTSPTFTLLNEYPNNIYHFDVYRLKDSDEFYDLGFDEYFEDSICVIEWGLRVEEAILRPYTEINIKYLDGTKREIEIMEKTNECACS